MSDLTLARLYVGLLALLAGGAALFLSHTHSGTLLKKLPRAKIPGIILSTLCWIWVATELLCHPIDMIPFSPQTILILCGLCIPLSWFLLSNLLCSRAIGGLMMLWPMPVFLVVREQVTLWRLIPVVAGYISLTAGMIIVFYPWTFRVACDKLATHSTLRHGMAVACAIFALLLIVSLLMLGKVVGE